ncbi:MAG: 50S ribosomal protein L4 [Candidatus Aminicenantaceae bacterium]
MAKIHVLDKSGKKSKEINLPREVFSYPVKNHLLYEAVISHQANQRAGTASTKTRREVRGGGRKPWRQKGTGRARAGSIRSPLWRKGGITFGPKPRSHFYSLPKKAKRNALKSALSMKFAEKQMIILDEIVVKEPKTKEGKRFLDNFKLDSALIVGRLENENLFLSLRNIPRVKAVDCDQVNTYDVLKHKWIVFTRPAFESLMEKLK